MYGNRANSRVLTSFTTIAAIESRVCPTFFRAKPGPVGVDSESEYQTTRSGPSCFAYPHSFSPSLESSSLVATSHNAHLSWRHSSFPQSGKQCKAHQRPLLYSNRREGRSFCLRWHPIRSTPHAVCIIYSWYVHFSSACFMIYPRQSYFLSFFFSTSKT
jgi:hypothetical protein